MARREYHHSPQCVHEGCTERAYYVFTTRAEQRAEMESLRRTGGWRCVRHRNPDEVLSVESPEKCHVLVSYETSYGRFWRKEGAKSGSGFAYGPGFRAFAEDFPPGTRIVVTARLEPAARSQGRMHDGLSPSSQEPTPHKH